MLDKKINVCKIDNVTIENLNGRCVHSLGVYLRNKHKISLEEYVLKYEYNGIRPKCSCGCGNYVNFSKGSYFKYFSDHKNKTKPSNDVLVKMKIGKDKALKLKFRLERLNVTENDLYNLYIKFVNFEINFTDIEKIYALDKRTLKKYWIELKFIDNIIEFERICKKHKHFWGNKNKSHVTKIPDDVLFEIYNFIRDNKNKITISEVKNKLNLEFTPLVIYKRLIESFTKKEIDEYINLGISSRPEIEFYNILKFYYGHEVKKNFWLERKQYDYLLLDKILIEYDGDYWHSKPKAIERDKLKDKIAHDNGFFILRIKDSESKNIDTLNKINELYLMIKKNENNL